MRTQIPLKSTLRQPVRSVLLLLLVGLISFAFIARAVEGLVVTAELNRITATYRSVGTVKPIATRLTQDNVWVPDEIRAMVDADPAVQYSDGKRLISAVMDGVYSPDVDAQTPYTSMTYAYATLKGKTMGDYLDADNKVAYQGCSFTFEVDTYLFGYPEYDRTGQTIIYRLEGLPGEMAEVFDGAVVGRRYFVKGQYWGMYNYKIQPPTGLPSSRGSRLYLRPVGRTGEYFVPVTGDEFNTIPGLAEELAAQEQNMRTVFLRTVKDMEFLPERQNLLSVRSGRFLTAEDTAQANRVCMIRSEFADWRGLKVGDTLTVTMRNLPETLEYPAGHPAPRAASERERGYILDPFAPWREWETVQETFTIVGIYSTANPYDRFFTVSRNNVLVPDTCVPADWTGAAFYGDYHFLLKNPGEQEAFYRNYFGKLSDMGYLLEFAENDFAGFAATARPIRQNIRVGVVTYAVLLVVVFALTAFLYFHQRARDFAILRALGTPVRAAARQMILPILILSGTGILAGGVPAWFYAQRQAARVLLAVEGAQFAPPPVLWLPPLLLGLYVLVAGFVLAHARALAKRPVLELLQGRRATRRRGRGQPAVAAPEDGAPVQYAPVHALHLAPLPRRSGTTPLHILRTAVRRMVRLRGKSLLVVLTAAVALLILSWMPASMEQNAQKVDELYDTTRLSAVLTLDHRESGVTAGGGDESSFDQITSLYVRSDIISGVAMREILALDEFIGDYYTEAFAWPEVVLEFEVDPAVRQGATLITTTSGQHLVTKDGTMIPLVQGISYADAIGVKDYDRFSANQRGAFRPVFAPGFGPADLGGEGGGVLVSRWLLDQLEEQGVTLGGDIWLRMAMRDTRLKHRVIGVFEDFQTSEDAYPGLIMTIDGLLTQTKGVLRYSCAEFTLNPSANRSLDELRAQVGAIMEEYRFYPRILFVIRDYSLTSAVEPLERNIALMRLLYPVAMAATALLSAALALLLILQAEKDAAILRVLGTTKRRTRIILLFEQGVLCLTGLLLSGGLACVLFGSANLPAAALYFAACLLAALTGAYLVTRKKPLELLQVKE